ncbi:MAG: sulfatase [Prolixibacteraceae bacterium]
MKNNRSLVLALTPLILLGAVQTNSFAKKPVRKPNILFALADDQSYPYASAYGTKGISTPAFDQVAKSGILFSSAFVAAPQCSPSRAAILTGKNIWQLEEAGTHGSYFPKKFTVFTDLLEQAGYGVGYTGKGWDPGNWKDAGRSRNPAGPEYSEKLVENSPTTGISSIDYFANFVAFYEKKAPGQPFFFWYGSHEPHRVYEQNSGLRAGKKPQDAYLPSFLPDDAVSRNDINDYALEIEYFDQQLAKILAFLKEKGELDNTLVVVTADNGMSFPSAKANLFEFGSHVPLAISWPAAIRPGQKSDKLVSLIDLAPTFLELGEVKEKPEMTGTSLGNLLLQRDPGTGDSYILTGRERHTHARPDNLGYPARAIRNTHYLYVLNMKSDRWPAGDPDEGGASKRAPGQDKGYFDIDDSPTKQLMINNRDKWPALFAEGFEKRAEEQLFDIQKDAGCTTNLAADSRYEVVRKAMKDQLLQLLKEQKDPRVTGNGDIFESYPRFGAMKAFPGFSKKGEYNENFKNSKQ